MKPRQILARHVLCRIEDLIKGETVYRQLRFLEAAQWWPREKLDAYKLDRLQKLLAHAYACVPFYRSRFDEANLTPSQVSSLDCLPRMPVLTRQDLRKYASSDLRSTIHDFSRCKRGSSSGSSGDPVVYYKDAHAVSMGRAALLEGLGMAGWRLADPTVVIWGNYRTVQGEWSRMTSRAKAFLHGETRIQACRLTTAHSLKEALTVLRKTKAEFLHGYANAIYTLALTAQELGVTLERRFRGVLTTAETLSPQARQVIEATFGPVYDGYGCGEILGVAFQCCEGKEYHIVEPHVIVELEDVGFGHTKSVLLTDLDNYAMPLIRYRVGDVAVSGDGECNCGRTWRTLKAITGRTNDIITTPKGGKLLVPSVFGSSLLKEVSGIAQYQLALVSDGKVIVRIVPMGKLALQDVRAIEHYLDPYLSGVIDYAVEVVDHIPVSHNGKYKVVVDERQEQRGT